MRKCLLVCALVLTFLFAGASQSRVEAADRGLILFDDAYEMLLGPDLNGNVVTQSEAEEIVNAIIADIDTNYMQYKKSNRQAFYNMVESHIPAGKSGAVYKSMPEYFIAYVDALNAENGVSAGPEATTDNKDYSVDVTMFDSIVDFYLLTPTYRHIQMSTVNKQVNFQGSVLGDSSNYDISFQELPNQKIKVYSSDGSGVREVVVSTNMVVQGLNANYHYGTEQAFLFHNSQGSISLAYPDLTGLLDDLGKEVWLEYRLVGNYEDGMKMIDQNDIAGGRPEFDPSREWWDLLARMDAEFTAAHVAQPQSVLIQNYNFASDPLISAWYDQIITVEPDFHTALRVYDSTFVYEIIKGGYSKEEAEMVNVLRVRAYDFIRRGEDEQRNAQKIRSTKEALADRLYIRKKLEADPVLNEIFNQIAVYTGMTLQGHDVLSIEQDGSKIMIGLSVSEPLASGYPVYIYDLSTGEIYNDIMGGDLELVSTNAIQRDYGLDVGEYTPSYQVPADYQLNSELVDQLISSSPIYQ